MEAMLERSIWVSGLRVQARKLGELRYAVSRKDWDNIEWRRRDTNLCKTTQHERGIVVLEFLYDPETRSNFDG